MEKRDEAYEGALQDQIDSRGRELGKQYLEILALKQALREILSIGERHTDSAVGRRIADFREAITVARKALHS